jgi:hypothetical protein
MAPVRGSTVSRPAAISLALAALLAASCQRATGPTNTPGASPPVANTPVNALYLLDWSWDHRDVAGLRELFTDDFRFLFAMSDSAGNAFRDTLWLREDELIAAMNCFEKASSLVLDLDRSPTTLPDDRPGKNPRWHKTIRTHAALRAVVDLGRGPEVIEVNGYARFYFVRGDSAMIPPELVAAGVTSDSTRWRIDRWEDETLPPGGTSAHPARQMSWGAFKSLFRYPAAP